MVAAIQIFVAGAMLSAVMWVLNRPRATIDEESWDQRFEDEPVFDDGADIDDDFWPSTTRVPVIGPILDWFAAPVVERRRQTMLAMVFATFASFLLAVAFRGRFLQLLIVVAACLVVQLVLAARLGARIEGHRRARIVERARHQVVAPSRRSGTRIRAGRAGAVAAESGLATLFEERREVPATEDFPDLVSDLIDQAWAGADVEHVDHVDVGPDPVFAEDGSSHPFDHDPAGHDGASPDIKGPERTAEPEAGQVGEALFTRAAKDEPTRRRGKARPIYIESQLDDNEDVAHPRAVNET